MRGAPHLALRVTSDAANVTLVREVLSGVAEAIELDDATLHDVRTAVSEACNNVVLHAYGEGRGPLEVDIETPHGKLRVVVRDHGAGLAPHPVLHPEPLHGIGLAVIQALTERIELRGAPGEGTELVMEFDAPGARSLGDLPTAVAAPSGGGGGPAGAAGPDSQGTSDSGHAAGSATADARKLDLGGGALLTVKPSALAVTTFTRLVSALAARAGFSLDRLSDAQLVADALAAQIARALDGDSLHTGVTARRKEIELRIWPLVSGHGQRLLGQRGASGLDAIVAQLSDDIRVTPAEGCEILFVRLADPGPLEAGAPDRAQQ